MASLEQKLKNLEERLVIAESKGDKKEVNWLKSMIVQVELAKKKA